VSGNGHARGASGELRHHSLWNDLRPAGKPGQAKSLKGSRWALVKNPSDLTTEQRTTLAGIAKDNKRLYRAYLLKNNSAPCSPHEPVRRPAAESHRRPTRASAKAPIRRVFNAYG